MKLGDELFGMAAGLAKDMNESEFLTSLRTQKLSPSRFYAYLSSVYPLVTGFNRALIRSMSKIDHVADYRFVRALAEQLQEEQMHNQIYREKLEAYKIDHKQLHEKLVSYSSQFSKSQLENKVEDYCRRNSTTNPITGVFCDSPSPEVVMALYHRLFMTADNPQFTYWEHFAGQAGIEAIIFEIVSESIYPGVHGNPSLDLGKPTMRWWEEHSRQGSLPGRKSEEEKHLGLSKATLNKRFTSKPECNRILDVAEKTLALFAGSVFCQNQVESA